MLGWLFGKKKSVLPRGMTAEQAQQAIINVYGEFIETSNIGMDITDAKELPFRKDVILAALVSAPAVEKDAGMREAIKIAAITLAQYQGGIGPTRLSMFPDSLADLAKMEGEKLVKLMTDNSANVAKFEAMQRVVDAELVEIKRKIGMV